MSVKKTAPSDDDPAGPFSVVELCRSDEEAAILAYSFPSCKFPDRPLERLTRACGCSDRLLGEITRRTRGIIWDRVIESAQ